MSEALVESLTAKKEGLLREVESIKKVVERDRSTLKESERALERATERVNQIDVEIRQAASA